MFIFNPKLEWALLIAMFYVGILFVFGVASEINTQPTHVFMDKFVNSPPVKSIRDIINKYTEFDATDYLKYLILIPSAFNLASIKLITNYDGNKKIHRSKSKLKQLDNIKLLICAHVFLLAIIVLFGFPPSYISEYMPIFMPNIPLGALGLLYIISIAELLASISIYISY
ncbi:MAG: hypothetical protein ACOVRN_19120 [Flavobacterium sp.]